MKRMSWLKNRKSCRKLNEIDVHLGLFGLAETIWESLLVCELNLHAHY